MSRTVNTRCDTRLEDALTLCRTERDIFGLRTALMASVKNGMWSPFEFTTDAGKLIRVTNKDSSATSLDGAIQVIDGRGDLLEKRPVAH